MPMCKEFDCVFVCVILDNNRIGANCIAGYSKVNFRRRQWSIMM